MSTFRFNESRRIAARGAARLGAVAPVIAQPVPAPATEAAADDEPTAIATQQINPRSGVSLAQATAIAQSRYQGRVVRAATFMQGDRVVHEIRILGTDGTVRTVLVDGQTGQIL